MKATWLMAAAAGAAVCTSALGVSIARIERPAGYGAGAANDTFGGEFTVIPQSGPGVGKTGMASDRAANSFQTFCVELGQNITPNRNYEVQVNTEIITGAPGMNTISDETAWLYVQFRRGTLSGYDYDPSGNRGLHANSLQLTIWFFQDQLAPGSGRMNDFMADGLAQQWAMAAQDAVDDGFVNRIVRALNVGDVGADPQNWARQDMLTLIPLPTGGGLAAAGLLGLAAIRRRRA